MQKTELHKETNLNKLKKETGVRKQDLNKLKVEDHHIYPILVLQTLIQNPLKFNS